MNSTTPNLVFRPAALARWLRFPFVSLLLAVLSPVLFIARADTACGDSGLIALDNGSCAESGVFAIDNGGCAESEVFTIMNCPDGADFNRDGQVNLSDLALLRACISGPSVPAAAGCEGKDLDGDGDVDQADFGSFQRSFTGDLPANPDCAN